MKTIERFIPDGAAVLRAEDAAAIVTATNTDSPVQRMVETEAYWHNSGNVSDGNIEVATNVTALSDGTTSLDLQVMTCVDAAKSGAAVAMTLPGVPVGINNFIFDPCALKNQRPTHAFWFLRGVTANSDASDPATGTLTQSGQPSDTETVVIGSRTYTFQASLTNVAGNVKIGGTAAATLTNLFHAINASGGTPGTDYAAATTAHPQVTATNPTATTLVVTAIAAGAAGNAIATTETATNYSFGGLTLAGGDDAGAISVNYSSFYAPPC